jgi:hypothetical protein
METRCRDKTMLCAPFTPYDMAVTNYNVMIRKRKFRLGYVRIQSPFAVLSGCHGSGKILASLAESMSVTTHFEAFTPLSAVIYVQCKHHGY